KFSKPSFYVVSRKWVPALQEELFTQKWSYQFWVKKEWDVRPSLGRDRPSNLPIKSKTKGLAVFLITSKALDARRRGVTTEAYGAIRRKEKRSKATPQMMPCWWIRGAQSLFDDT
ncbi:MAG: hypothetical protein P8175_09970, partial [Deltaproteobacteria bacterium]